MPRIAIIGGGLSGVSCAYELTRLQQGTGGHPDFVLYEASNRLGGIVETHRESGFVIECGADSWVTEKPWARELAVELGLEDQILPSNDAHRRTYLLLHGQLVPMPDGMRMMVPGDLAAIAISPLFSESARKAYCEEPSRAQELKAFAASRRADWDESVAGFVQRHFGSEVAEKIAGPLLAGVFGGDIRKLSVRAVMAAFVKMEHEHGSLVLALQQQTRSGGNKPSVFTSLKGGLQTLIDGMAARIASSGASSAIRLKHAVEAVTPVAGRWEITSASGKQSFDQVLFATPAHITRKLVAPWNQELQSLLEMEATSAVIAAFAFDREESAQLKVPDGFGFLAPPRYESAPDESAPTQPELLAGTFVDQKFSHRAPEGCVVLRAFFGGDSAPLLLHQPDAYILDLARRQLSSILGEIPKPKIALVRRWLLSLPQYTVGHQARVARVEEIFAGLPGLHMIGNALHGVGLPDMVRQGRQTAKLLSPDE